MNPTIETPHRSGKESCQFAEAGFQIVPPVISHSECDDLAGELTALFERQRSLSKTRIAGVRNLLRMSLRVAELAESARLRQLIEEFLGQNAFPVRAIFFDKTADSNWRVPWHEDLTIAVTERIETEGFGPWSIKNDVIHVQPPVSILENMVAVRLQLDDCSRENGVLRVVPGSHRHGEFSSSEIEKLTQSECVACEVPQGGALVMRPLLLHASSPARQPSHRRVLHIEYAGSELPNGLAWFDR